VFARTGSPHVLPPSRLAATNTSASPFRLSAQHTYTDPRSFPRLTSHPVTGSPLCRGSPTDEKFHPPGWSATFTSLPNENPPSSDLSNRMPSAPAQAMYTSPFGPTAGTAPSTVFASSSAPPDLSDTRTGGLNVFPPSFDRAKKMRLRCSGSALPYLSNRVQATYTLPRCGEPVTPSTAIHGLSSIGSTVLT